MFGLQQPLQAAFYLNNGNNNYNNSKITILLQTIGTVTKLLYGHDSKE